MAESLDNPMSSHNSAPTKEPAPMTMDGFDIKSNKYEVGAVSSAAERALHMRQVTGSIPVPPTTPTRVPERPSSPDKTFLYVMRSGGFVKIGYAANLYIRLSNARVDNPHGVDLVSYREMPKERAKRIERYCHFHLEDHCISGEWFRVTADEAHEAIKLMETLKSCSDDAP